MQAEANLEINSYIDEISSETVHDLLNEEIISENAPTTVRPKKKRLRQTDLVEMYNRITASPVSGYQSQTSPDFTQSRYDISRKRVPSDIPCCNEKPELSKSVQSSDEMSEDIQTPQIPRVSSPIEYQPLACSVSTVTEGCSKEELVERRSSVMLCSGSEVTLHEATSLLELFSSRFALSYEASLALYSITEAVLPRDNKLPSGHSLVRKMKQDLSNQTRAFLTNSKGNVIILNFRNQLRKIVQRNLNQIAAYSEFRLQNSDVDLNPQVAPIVLPYSSLDLEMNLVLSTDGVNIKKSTYKKELWPVWLQCSDLPPILRMSRKNIILACLFVGNGAPNWNEIVPWLRTELISPIEFDNLNFPRAKVIFKVRLLVADMCAKAHVLNMVQFNGCFGCHFCTAEGKTIGKTHAYYPFRQSGDVREPELNDKYIGSAELLSSWSGKFLRSKRSQCVQ